MKKLEEKSLNVSEKGTEFEKSCKAYLLTDPAYSELEKVWLWAEFPYNNGHDKGIDLVGKTKNGEYWAIQSKFYNENHSVSKKDVDTFLPVPGENSMMMKERNISIIEEFFFQQQINGIAMLRRP